MNLNNHTRLSNKPSRRPKRQQPSEEAKQFRAEWRASLENALGGLSDKKTDGLHLFLEGFAPKLTKKRTYFSA